MRLFKRVFVLTLALILSITPAKAALGPDSIPAAFDEMLKVASLANPAVIIIDGTTGQIVYGKNIDSQRKPASVIKLLTAAVTLDYLDPQSVFETNVSIAPENKTIVIRGSLDPWISSDHGVARKMNRASLTSMGSKTLTAIKTANGGSLKNYQVVYSNLYSEDIAKLKAYWANREFKPNIKSVSDEEALLQQGDAIATESSPTVAAILDWMLLWSDNLLADRLARLSARAAGYSPDMKGVNKIFRTLLTRLEIDQSRLIVVDASGLSKKNKITAQLMGEFLYKIHKDEKYVFLHDSLPVGGVSGTLQDRFTTTAPNAVGLVRAKTGTLNGTATLAGYVESTDREYVFVVLADKIPLGNSALIKARAAMDRVLGRIAAPNIPVKVLPAP